MRGPTTVWKLQICILDAECLLCMNTVIMCTWTLPAYFRTSVAYLRNFKPISALHELSVQFRHFLVVIKRSLFHSFQMMAVTLTWRGVYFCVFMCFCVYLYIFGFVFVYISVMRILFLLFTANCVCVWWIEDCSWNIIHECYALFERCLSISSVLFVHFDLVCAVNCVCCKWPVLCERCE